MVHVDGPWFRDEHGRRLILRGVNLGGSSKVPTTSGWRHLPAGQPGRAPRRLLRRAAVPAGRGGRALRPAQALGPDLPPTADHVGGDRARRARDSTTATTSTTWRRSCARPASTASRCSSTPIEDVWSRFTGGDGAPAWTLEAAGFDLRNLHATGAAFLHQEHGDPLPRMIWPTNNGKLAAATMFTLFFGGNDFAPQLKVDGEPIQEFLQHHYLEAIAQVAHRLRGLAHVVGYDTFNEPSAGYIGVRDLGRAASASATGRGAHAVRIDAAGRGRRAGPSDVGHPDAWHAADRPSSGQRWRLESLA